MRIVVRHLAPTNLQNLIIQIRYRGVPQLHKKTKLLTFLNFQPYCIGIRTEFYRLHLYNIISMKKKQVSNTYGTLMKTYPYIESYVYVDKVQICTHNVSVNYIFCLLTCISSLSYFRSFTSKIKENALNNGTIFVNNNQVLFVWQIMYQA